MVGAESSGDGRRGLGGLIGDGPGPPPIGLMAQKFIPLDLWLKNLSPNLDLWFKIIYPIWTYGSKIFIPHKIFIPQWLTN